MKAYSLLIVIVGLMIAAPMFAQASGISVTEIDDNVFQFTLTANFTEPVRWSFGDGATSTEPAPVHEFQPGTYSVIAEDVEGRTFTATLDNEPPAIDTDTGTFNAGPISVPGGFLLLSCSCMFLLAKTNNHPLADLLGKRGKGLVMVAYFTGGLIGGILVFDSLFPGVIS